MSSAKTMASSSSPLPGTMTKLPPIPDGARVEKRPLNRRQPPASSKSRIIYVSSRTPFMAVVKRVRKQLDASLQAASAAPKNASVHSRVEALKRAGDETRSEGSVVTVMGTGKAIERTLAVASWFEQQGDCLVEMRTGTVATIDDVVVEDYEVEDESRLRRLSCLEVSVKLK